MSIIHSNDPYFMWISFTRLSEKRGTGIGRALLFSCLHAMAAQGYAYAVIGGAGPAEFFVHTAGAMPIEGSFPGIYRDRLKTKDAVRRSAF